MTQMTKIWSKKVFLVVSANCSLVIVFMLFLEDVDVSLITISGVIATIIEIAIVTAGFVKTRRGRETPGSAERMGSTQVDYVLDSVAMLLPPRMVKEDLADLGEELADRIAAGQSDMRIRLRTAIGIFWILLNLVRYVFAALRGMRLPRG